MVSCWAEHGTAASIVAATAKFVIACFMGIWVIVLFIFRLFAYKHGRVAVAVPVVVGRGAATQNADRARMEDGRSSLALEWCHGHGRATDYYKRKSVFDAAVYDAPGNDRLTVRFGW